MASTATPATIPPIIMPLRLVVTGGSAVEFDPDAPITGRDMVLPAAAGVAVLAAVVVVAVGAAGRDIVDEAAAAVLAAAARIPVLEAADAGVTPERIPVDVSLPEATGFGADAAEGATGDAALAGAPTAPAGSVVPHCTQNFAPG
jgi:hypothetical protein